MISLRQARSLLAVVEHGSVSRAAVELCLAPSSVSAQLRELSATVGVTLFEPVGRGLVLSTAGQQLLPKFRQLIALSEDISSEARFLASEPAGQLRLYAPSSMCIYRLPPLIQALQSRAPAIELQLEHDPYDYKRGLAERSIDAAILVLDQPEPNCEHQPIAIEDAVFVAHPDLVTGRALTLKKLQQLPLITTEPTCSYRIAAQKHFSRAGLRLEPRQSLSNVEVIRRCLLSKMGVGLLPRCVVAEDLQQGKLLEQKVQGTPYRFESSVVWLKETEMTPRLNLFLQLVRELYDQ